MPGVSTMRDAVDHAADNLARTAENVARLLARNL